MFSVGPARPAAAAGDGRHVQYDAPGTSTGIGLIGDSVASAIPLVGQVEPLRRFDYLIDTASCRRTLARSCFNPTPTTALEVLRQYSGRWGDVLVMATGYNDGSSTFGAAVDAIMAEASRQGIGRVMWMTMRTADVRCVPASYRSTTTTFRDNNLILLQKAQQYGNRLQIADWATYSSGMGSILNQDGIHAYTRAGARTMAQFIADSASKVLSGQSVTPSCARTGSSAFDGEWTFLRYGMGGIAVADAQRALLARGINLPTGVDGYYGVTTIYAVNTFQRHNGLEVTGRIDERTARALGLIGSPWPNSGRGAAGRATVRRIQQALVDRGVYVRGGVSGVFDIYTVYAVQTFQRHNGLRPTGIVDQATAIRLGLMAGPPPSSVWTAISDGSRGLLVSRSQQRLLDLGIYLPTGVTGTFDLRTRYAVQTFQRHNGLAVSGVIDVETARKMGLLSTQASPVAGWIDLGIASGGPMVERAEGCLIARGVHVRDGVDGAFGLWDYYAVQTFQRHNGLRITGRIDVATASKLGVFRGPCVVASVLAATAPAIAPTSTTTSSTSTTTSSTSTTTSSTSTTSTTSTTTSSTMTTTTSLAPSGGTVSGVVWQDSDGDGVRLPTEPAYADPLVVRLVDPADPSVVVGIADVEPDGSFDFADVAPGRYQLEIEIPTHAAVVAARQGIDETLDSDFLVVADSTPPVARTDPFEVAAGSEVSGIDLGLSLLPVVPPTSTETSTTTVAAPTLPDESDGPGSTPPESTTTTSTTSPPPVETSTPPATTTSTPPTTVEIPPPTEAAAPTTAPPPTES